MKSVEIKKAAKEPPKVQLHIFLRKTVHHFVRFCTRDGPMQFGAERSASESGPYGRLGWTALEGLGLRTLAGRILRMAALPARWQARHMYQLATVR